MTVHRRTWLIGFCLTTSTVFLCLSSLVSRKEHHVDMVQESIEDSKDDNTDNTEPSFSRPENHSTSNTSMEMTQEERKRQLREACKRLSPEPWSLYKLKAVAAETSSLLVSDEMQFIYCRIGKVASTTWIRVLLAASGKVRENDPNKLTQTDAYHFLNHRRILRKLSDYHTKAMDYRLKNYFKFVFVRHPYDRLISAFNDRLKSDHDIPRRLFTKQIKRYRRPTDNISKDQGIQFNEFVRYIVDPATKAAGFNPHWRPQYDRCHPCLIDYDFIGHYETLAEDATAVLDRIGVGSRVQFPSSDRHNRHAAGHNATRRMLETFRTVDAEDAERLRTDVYRNDFEVFGY